MLSRSLQALSSIHYGWIMLTAVIVMAFASSGARFSFGVFVQPMTTSLGWERGSLALAASINLLIAGFMRPGAGWLSDRYGAKSAAIAGIFLAAVALALTSFTAELWQFYLTYGILLAAGYALASPVTVTTLVGHWFVKRRSLAMSVGSVGTALGELIVVPLAMLAVLYAGWEIAFQILAGFMLVVVLPIVWLLIYNRPSDRGLRPFGADASNAAAHRRAAGEGLGVSEALRHPDVWKLSIGFFVCGFTMSFASTHFIPFAMDMGIEPMAAANALGVVGACSIVGGLIAGWLGDRFPRKNVLAVVYMLRGLCFVVLLQADSVTTLYLASFLMGISWTSTSPLSSAITADRCGLKNLGTIFGTIFTIMPIGSAIGAWLGGVVYDTTHSYGLILGASAIAGFIASIVVFSIGGPSTPRRVETPRATPVGASA
jgi:MFS family permease